MSDAMPLNRLPRGIPTKILNFDGPSFSLQLTQAEKDFAGLSASKVDQRRSKLHNDKLKEVQVDEASKETKNQVGSKRKKPMKDSRNQKLNDTPNNVFAVYVNGTKLHFTLREFALVTGLKCIGKDEDFEFSETPPNRLIATYFGSANTVKKKHLRQCFNDKAWGPDNDEDALKISLLYFIHTFIFSSEKNSATIPRLDFDLVESGRYFEYHWGIKAFEVLINSINKKMDALKKYYRIAGMPLAMQTRIAEIYDRYEDTDSDANVAKQEDVVCEYIRGYRLHANIPWHTVDNVLIPVNLKEKLHWVLVVVTFKDRYIKVYDSYMSSGHDVYVVSEIVKLAKLLPLYLSISGFYRDSQGID
ncbi:uncharacterized protein [Nicotiana sylvestris]|uniref:uncharacterized protein n=1 Tax=Nicotiana sylvestris TaxID=4096 RepID=UPI00388CA3D7